MNKRKLTVDELTRLAFVWAEQDRNAMADAWPAGSDERKEAEAECRQLRDHRMKRWGRTKLEAVMDGAKSMRVTRPNA